MPTAAEDAQPLTLQPGTRHHNNIYNHPQKAEHSIALSHSSARPQAVQPPLNPLCWIWILLICWQRSSWCTPKKILHFIGFTRITNSRRPRVALLGPSHDWSISNANWGQFLEQEETRVPGGNLRPLVGNWHNPTHIHTYITWANLIWQI